MQLQGAKKKKSIADEPSASQGAALGLIGRAFRQQMNSTAAHRSASASAHGKLEYGKAAYRTSVSEATPENTHTGARRTGSNWEWLHDCMHHCHCTDMIPGFHFAVLPDCMVASHAYPSSFLSFFPTCFASHFGYPMAPCDTLDDDNNNMSVKTALPTLESFDEDAGDTYHESIKGHTKNDRLDMSRMGKIQELRVCIRWPRLGTGSALTALL